MQCGIERLTLDAVNLNIQSVQIDNTPQSFDYDGSELHIQLPHRRNWQSDNNCDRLPVEKTQRGLYFIAPDKHSPQQTHPSLD